MSHCYCHRKKDCSPAESAAIMEEVRALEELLQQLKAQAVQRQQMLEEAQRLQLFQKETRDLFMWAEAIQEHLLEEETGSDVASAQALLKDNLDLKQEIDLQRAKLVVFDLSFAILA